MPRQPGETRPVDSSRRTVVRQVIPTEDGSELAVVVVATTDSDGTPQVTRTVKLDGVEFALIRDISPAWDSYGRSVYAVDALDGTRIGTRPSVHGAARLAHRKAAPIGGNRPPDPQGAG